MYIIYYNIKHYKFQTKTYIVNRLFIKCSEIFTIWESLSISN